MAPRPDQTQVPPPPQAAQPIEMKRVDSALKAAARAPSAVNTSGAKMVSQADINQTVKLAEQIKKAIGPAPESKGAMASSPSTTAYRTPSLLSTGFGKAVSNYGTGAVLTAAATTFGGPAAGFAVAALFTAKDAAATMQATAHPKDNRIKSSSHYYAYGHSSHSKGSDVISPYSSFADQAAPIAPARAAPAPVPAMSAPRPLAMTPSDLHVESKNKQKIAQLSGARRKINEQLESFAEMADGPRFEAETLTVGTLGKLGTGVKTQIAFNQGGRLNARQAGLDLGGVKSFLYGATGPKAPKMTLALG